VCKSEKERGTRKKGKRVNKSKKENKRKKGRSMHEMKGDLNRCVQVVLPKAIKTNLTIA
jgi:hypothetical protein